MNRESAKMYKYSFDLNQCFEVYSHFFANYWKKSYLHLTGRSLIDSFYNGFEILYLVQLDHDSD